MQDKGCALPLLADHHHLPEAEKAYLDACDKIEAEIKCFLMTGNTEYLENISKLLDSNPDSKRRLCRVVQGAILSINEALGIKKKGKFSDVLSQINQKFGIDYTTEVQAFQDIPISILLNRESQILTLIKL
ncbi:MAG: hypothetical protein AAFW75_24625 [Cyanobacteria bacterium J06636_16]